MSLLPLIDRARFTRYAGLSLPRHVAYPMPSWWRPITPAEAANLRRRGLAAIPQRDLSLYLHVPFCEALCKFCACNRVIMRRGAVQAGTRVEQFLAAMEQEITRRSEEVQGRPVRQIHWGGGTPTYLNEAEIARLHNALTHNFQVMADAEISIEIDPRVTTRGQLQLLASLGFNRVSLGVQDFDPHVQAHVNRVQPYEMVEQCVSTARAAGFSSVNFDLIYGLPYQTRASMQATLEQTVRLAPDRIALYHYAQIPEKVANHRAINHMALPDSDAKLDMFLDARAQLSAAGYEFIGLDHFAKPQEPLARARRDGTLQRNFQGMTTGKDLDLIGMGPSAISVFPGQAYLQNVHDPNDYAAAIQQGEPAERGLELSRDDAIRQWLLLQLYCDAAIDARRAATHWDIDFSTYFAGEMQRLGRLQEDGLVRLRQDGSLQLTDPLGRVLMRNVAAVFDAYLDPQAFHAGQSQAFSRNA
jgi:oxygen-independent coproporphyrinogen-3 oxidase